MRKLFTLSSLTAALLVAPAFANDLDISASKGGEITYASHIAGFIQENCQQCHQPNGVAPFSLMNYRQAKGWGKMMKEVVLDGRMPPWHADGSVAHYSNDRSLSDEQKRMIATWVDSGMPRGNPAEEPAPIEWHNEWRIGEPDMIFEMPEEAVIEPTGVVPYQYFVTPTNFEEDKWVNVAEVLPGNPKVVHHIIMFVRNSNEDDGVRGEDDNGFFDAFAPGTVPMDLEPGMARKIPKGADLVWQVHYTPTGKLEKDRSKFGVKFYDGPVEKELVTNAASKHDFAIPPRADNHRVEAEMTFSRAATIYDMSPHMHYRGKSFEYTLIYPDGKKETLLKVPNYDFNWQTTYKLAEPAKVPAGTKLHCVAHFDNSADNPYNPDPDKTVRWGDQTWEEMMIGFFNMSWEGDTKQAAADVSEEVQGD